jgi:signal transduction histidine kinase
MELEEPLSLSAPFDEALEHALRHGYIAECNDAMARMYGFTCAGDFVGTRLSSTLKRDDPGNVAMLRAFLEAGCRIENVETHELDRDAVERVFINNMVGIIEDGRLLRVWGTQRDVTASRRLEGELRQMAKMEAVGRLAAGLAHDFNNLLTAIVGHSEMAEERVRETAAGVKAALLAACGPAGIPSDLPIDDACERVQVDIEEIRLAALRASSLTRQLLAFTRKQVVQPVVLDVSALLARTEKLLRRLLPDDVEVSLDLEPAL